MLQIAMKETKIQHCKNTNAQNPFYCETNQDSVLESCVGGGEGVMQINPDVYDINTANFKENVKKGALILAEKYKLATSCGESTKWKGVIRLYNGCSSSDRNKYYVKGVLKYKDIVEKGFPECKS